MICIIDLDAEDSEWMVGLVSMPNCISMVTRDLGALEDRAARILPDSISTIVRPDRQF